jgi:hypothetical protein
MEALRKLQSYLWDEHVLHGSATHLKTIEPRQANQWSFEPQYNKCAVYATRDVRIAIIFATMRLPKSGSASLRIWGGMHVSVQHSGDVIIRPGFVHVLSRDTFTYVDATTLVSFDTVTPIDVIAVDPSIYTHLKQFEVIGPRFF